MKNNFDMYNIIVHTINLLLLGCIVFFAFFAVVNISPISYFNGVQFGTIMTLLLIWGVNYWYQYYKKRKWIVPIVGTILFVGIALLLFGVVLPILTDLFVSK